MTGDVLTVMRGPDGKPAGLVGEPSGGWIQETVGDDVYVVPNKAAGLVNSGRVDRELFNVTRLVAEGHLRSTPVIVTGGVGTMSVKRSLPSIGASVIDVTQQADFWRDVESFDKIWLNGMAKPALDRSVAQIGGPVPGYSGQGATVAVLDTGIKADHPDLAGKVLEAKDFTGTSPNDEHGHGTHVAGIIASNGAPYRGVAPDATLLSGKVCTASGCPFDAIIAGMEWAASKARVVNMSLGNDAPSDGTDPLSQAVNKLSAQTGALFVVAAGNSGPGKLGTPAAADAALTVGAVDRNDVVASFSSTGPRLGDSAVKPDLAAPGVGIVSAGLAGGHVGMSGTSMATPHVAGAAALLAAAHPSWRGEDLKAALTSSTAVIAGDPFTRGTGRVDLRKAVGSPVRATGVVNFGYFAGPYGSVPPISKKVLYSNDSAAPVRLDLAWNGSSAVTVSPASVEVPAGGSASVTVTLDVNQGELGRFTGELVAGGLRTVVAFHKDRTYGVTVKAIDRNGNPGRANVILANAAGASARLSLQGNGQVRVRELGEYTLAGFVSTMDGAEVEQTAVPLPALQVTGETEVVLDARLGKPVSWTVPHRVKPAALQFGMHRGKLTVLSGVTPTARMSVVPVDGPADFELTTRAWLVGEHTDYHLVVPSHGQVPRYSRSQLASVRTSFHATRPNQTGSYAATARRPYDVSSLIPRVDVPFPRSVTKYVLAGDTTYGQFVWGRFPFESTVLRMRTYAPRERAAEDWFRGPLMPGSTEVHYPMYREKDQFLLNFSEFTDSFSGHALEATALDKAVRVYRDDALVWQGTNARGIFNGVAGPDPAVYRVEMDVRKGAQDWNVSTESRSVWTFRSQRSPERAYLPVLINRWDLNLDGNNTAPGGLPFVLKLSPATQYGAPLVPIKEVSVGVSFDRGRTWRPVPHLLHSGDSYRGMVFHPRSGSVALRVQVTDVQGNSLDQTVYDAYRLR
ncbi:S8 family serine peptidase [Lentzea sp. NBRC 105346]|uniref:S8 family serine peptidase n=1 Tax=Lentzea sp. NBRC 105346 TaxID=3032205 RepID=UPI002557A147|nr:S8 family serine peptidase [Lentzea sp. NBRC 105346]